MTVSLHSFTRLAAVAAAVAAVVSLSSCALLPLVPGTPVVQSGSGSSNDDTATGDASDAPDASTGADDAAGLGTTIPDTFPAEIPLPTLDVAYAIDLGTGWAVGFATDDPTGQWAALDAQLVASGWSVLSTASGDSQAFGAYEKGNYQVQISAAPAPESGYDTGIVAYNVILLS